MSKAIKGVKKVFGSVIGAFTGKKIKAPKVPKPVVMPTPDEDAINAIKRRSLAEQFGRRGRASTILTNTDDTLG